MDTMIQLYMEETEDMLQKAEECIIRLETQYSPDDVNELFRIAHTIKGSSHVVGYEDIGNIMHKIEDMLDCARNGNAQFDQSIVSLCFEGLDIVKKMLQYRKEPGSQEMIGDLINAASEINEKVEAFIRTNRRHEAETTAEHPAMGLVSSLMSKEPKGKNKFYITFFVEEDAPMISPVIIMILKSVEDIGTLVYSSLTDSYFSGCSDDHEIKTLDIILCTDIEEAELYTYFALSYVERINIVNLTRSKLEDNDYYFDNGDDTFYITILGVFVKLCNMFFRRPEEKNISKEELHVAESLYCEVVNVFDRMKNKSKISSFIGDFNELLSFIIKMQDMQTDNYEEYCSGMRIQLTRLMERANNFVKGKHLFKVFKAEKNDFIDRLKNFMRMVNKASTFIIFIDFLNCNNKLN